jgi:tetratricopeptide (TPR) repeat protein
MSGIADDARAAVAGDAGADEVAVASGEKDYDGALARGQAAAGRGDPAGAIAAFEEALASRPGDGRAQLELGWAAFRAGDLDRAEEATRRALEASTDRQIEAPSRYNLGRILEQRGDRAAAAAEYRRSLALRANSAVRARLEAITARVAGNPLEPRRLEGPFESLAAFCVGLGEGERCAPPAAGEIDGPLRAPASGALREVAIFVARADDGVDEHAAAYLGLRTAAGWFVSPALFATDDSGRGAMRTLAFAGGVLRVAAEQTIATRDDLGQRWSDREERLLLCGVGPSGIPRCTPPLVTARSVARADAAAADAPAATVRLGDGTVAIHGATLLEGDLLIDGDYLLAF